jgi:hypothetical protein
LLGVLTTRVRGQPLDLVEIRLVVVFRAEPVAERPAAQQRHDRLEARPAGLWDQDPVSRAEDDEQRLEHRGRRPGRDHDVVERGRDPVAFAELLDDRLAERAEPARERVPHPAVVHGGRGGVEDVRRRREVRLAELQVQDVCAGVAEVHDLADARAADGADRVGERPRRVQVTLTCHGVIACS